jgi:hypothetical protein
MYLTLHLRTARNKARTQAKHTTSMCSLQVLFAAFSIEVHITTYAHYARNQQCYCYVHARVIQEVFSNDTAFAAVLLAAHSAATVVISDVCTAAAAAVFNCGA